METLELRSLVENVLLDIRRRPVPLGISNRHLHLSLEDYERLFPGCPLVFRKDLYQPGQFAAEQVVSLVGPKGSLKNVRLLGPLRGRSQVEISRSDARLLGVDAPLRLSGDLDGTPGIRLVAHTGELQLAQGVIVAQRHIHMSPLDALLFGVRQGDRVRVAIRGTHRRTVFDDVAIRVGEHMRLEMHIDTDEANAADAGAPGATAIVEY
ncbi:phosphate propanoyltransferase [Martelella alba]|uniref:Phosphate propanoyltransferase n=1 Tax=Martelella alba TaxID=2590451 RepID=A0ABY2SQN6_9HYPH|nr:phosphate propanoyltransferase [Martelella alba]TKI08051.1 phosphate propanoyltransferase [Martelella alba]